MGPSNFVKDAGMLAVIKIRYMMFMLKDLFMYRLWKPNQDLEIANN